LVDLWEFEIPILIELEKRVVGDLPEVAVRVAEITAVTSPEDFLSLFDQGAADFCSQCQDFVHLGFGSGVISQREAGKSRTLKGDPDIFGQKFPRIKREDDARELEEGDVVLTRRGAFPTKAFFVKSERRFEVVYPERYEADSRLHKKDFFMGSRGSRSCVKTPGFPLRPDTVYP